MLYKTYSVCHTILAKILIKKQVKSHYFQSFKPWGLSIFKPITCILHHFAFLICCRHVIFSIPITSIQSLKLHFLMAFLPFLAMFLMVREGFIYTVATYFYAFRLAFCSIQPCVLQQKALHLAPKRTSFSGKTHRIQQQNALHLAAKCTAFS